MVESVAALLDRYKFSNSWFALVQSASVSYMITIEVQERGRSVTFNIPLSPERTSSVTRKKRAMMLCGDNHCLPQDDGPCLVLHGTPGSG